MIKSRILSNYRTILLTILFSAFVAPVRHSAESNPKPETIVAEYLRATGGAKLVAGIQTQNITEPLPEPHAFLAEFRKTLHSDNKLLSRYTYTEKETELRLDAKGNTKKSNVDIYQVFHGAEDWQTYGRQTVKNGKPLTAQELEKEDRDERQRVAKERAKRAKESEAKRSEKKAKEDREEQEVMDDLFSMYDLQLLRRESLNGVSTIVVSFKAKPDYKPKTADLRNLQHIAGNAWIAEGDHELVKIEAEVTDAISIVAGFLAKVQKGSTIFAERRKINDEIWLPFRAEAHINGKLLLLKGINIHEVLEYSDYRKFSVDTNLEFGEPKN
jgi:hypothetical protein